MGNERLMLPSSFVVPESASHGKDHQGWVSAHISDAAANPHIVKETGSRGFSIRICRSPKM